jgi:uncharacterized membrane protein YkvA (DUF1232 family)
LPTTAITEITQSIHPELFLTRMYMTLQKVINYKLPAKLKVDTKKNIEGTYLKCVQTIGDEEFCEVIDKIDNKLKITQDAATSWITDLSRFYSILFKIYDRADNLSDNGFNLIASALLYFINPFDVIPDFSPGLGYLDDLFVLIFCLKSLTRKDKEIAKKAFSKVKVR